MNHHIVRTPNTNIAICRVVKSADGEFLLEFKDKQRLEIVSKQWLDEELFRIFRYCPRIYNLK